jgi:hypothetical protein
MGWLETSAHRHRCCLTVACPSASRHRLKVVELADYRFRVDVAANLGRDGELIQFLTQSPVRRPCFGATRD